MMMGDVGDSQGASEDFHKRTSVHWYHLVMKMLAQNMSFWGAVV